MIWREKRNEDANTYVVGILGPVFVALNNHLDADIWTVLIEELP